jgi:hypothetical protein
MFKILDPDHQLFTFAPDCKSNGKISQIFAKNLGGFIEQSNETPKNALRS